MRPRLVLALGGLAALALGGCVSDPAELGITGPMPKFTAPVQDGMPRSGTSDSESGLVIDPNLPAGATGGRYWRYN